MVASKRVVCHWICALHDAFGGKHTVWRESIKIDPWQNNHEMVELSGFG